MARPREQVGGLHTAPRRSNVGRRWHRRRARQPQHQRGHRSGHRSRGSTSPLRKTAPCGSARERLVAARNAVERDRLVVVFRGAGRPRGRRRRQRRRAVANPLLLPLLPEKPLCAGSSQPVATCNFFNGRRARSAGEERVEEPRRTLGRMDGRADGDRTDRVPFDPRESWRWRSWARWPPENRALCGCRIATPGGCRSRFARLPQFGKVAHALRITPLRIASRYRTPRSVCRWTRHTQLHGTPARPLRRSPTLHHLTGAKALKVGKDIRCH